MLASLEQLHANLSPFASGLRGHVSLWANTHATHTFLPDDLAGFLRQQPQVRVTLEERTSTDIVVAVASGEIEVGVLADSLTLTDTAGGEAVKEWDINGESAVIGVKRV